MPENNNGMVLSKQLLLLISQESVNYDNNNDYDNKGRDLEIKGIHFIDIKKKETVSPMYTVDFMRRQQWASPVLFVNRCSSGLWEGLPVQDHQLLCRSQQVSSKCCLPAGGLRGAVLLNTHSPTTCAQPPSVKA